MNCHEMVLHSQIDITLTRVEVKHVDVDSERYTFEGGDFGG